MSPITPAKIYDGKLGVQLPAGLLAPFVYLSEMSLSRPELAPFCTYYLAAVAGNEGAIRKVLELVLITHEAASRHAHSKAEISVANSVIFLGNSLANMLERGELPGNDETPESVLKPEAAAKAEAKDAKQDAKRPKPRKSYSNIKPGTSRQEN